MSETHLKALFGTPVDASYIVDPESKIETRDGPDGQACVLIISGSKTEADVKRIFTLVVPISSRGKALNVMTDCVGFCETVTENENVRMMSAVMPGQTSKPAAIISFKTKACEPRAKEASAIGLAIIRTQ